MRGDREYAIRDEQPVLDCFEKAWTEHRKGGSARELVSSLLAEQAFWAMDLSSVPGLTDAVTGGLAAILEHGARGAVQALLENAIS